MKRTGGVGVSAAFVIGLSCLADAQNLNRPPSFNDYLVREVFRGKPAQANFSTDPDARRFITRVREGAKRGPNFAGHFTIVEWGCGTECQSFLIVDAKTGSIYSSPGLAALGLAFRINSRLLIVNPPEAIKKVYGTAVPGWLSTDYYVFEDNQFKLVYSTNKERLR
jgi:hypothetical protein